MADIAVENNETPVVEKEISEVESLKKVDADEIEHSENGKSVDDEKKENGDATDKPMSEDASESTEEEHSNGEKKLDDDEEDIEETNGDSTDAPAEAVKRKVDDAKTDETTATPEKKAKLDDAPVEKEVNGGSGDATELAAEA